VVVDDTTAARSDLGDYIVTALRSDLASFAIPTRWRFQTGELPVLGSEKIDKHALAAELAAGDPPLPSLAVAKL